MPLMASERTVASRRQWTPTELAREDSAGRARRAQARERTTEERLEETLRLSRFVGELRQGAPHDVRAR